MSKIEWTSETWNPVVGCSIVSPGCTNCYAMKWAYARMDRPHNQFPHYRGTTAPSKSGGVWTGKVAMAPEHILRKPLAWKKPRRIFVNSMGDLFHEDVPDEWIDRVFAVMALTPQHDYQVLTKRSGRMRAYMSARMAASIDDGPFAAPDRITVAAQMMCINADGTISREMYGTRKAIGIANQFGSIRWPLPNVWLGVSCEDQRRYDERKDDLEHTPAAVRFISFEPLLSDIALDLGPHDCKRCDATGSIDAWGGEPGCQQCPECKGTGAVYRKLDWAIVGGESGPGARPMHPGWARSIRDQCQAAGVPFFFKQWGEWEVASDQNGRRNRYSGHCMPDTGEKFTWVGIDGRTANPSAHDVGCPAYAMARVGKKAAGRLLDDRTWDEMPSTAESELDRAAYDYRLIRAAGGEPL